MIIEYHLSVAVLVPSESLHAFNPNFEREFVAVREHGTIILRPNISHEGTSCELMKTDYRRGYFAGMKEGYYQGYTDALECDEPANIDVFQPNHPLAKDNAAGVHIMTISSTLADTTIHNRITLWLSQN